MSAYKRVYRYVSISAKKYRKWRKIPLLTNGERRAIFTVSLNLHFVSVECRFVSVNLHFVSVDPNFVSTEIQILVIFTPNVRYKWHIRVNRCISPYILCHWSWVLCHRSLFLCQSVMDIDYYKLQANVSTFLVSGILPILLSYGIGEATGSLIITALSYIIVLGICLWNERFISTFLTKRKGAEDGADSESTR